MRQAADPAPKPGRETSGRATSGRVTESEASTLPMESSANSAATSWIGEASSSSADDSQHYPPLACVEHLLVFATVGVPVALLVLGFSVTGFGDETYIALTDFNWHAWALFLMATSVLVLLYVCDASYWKGHLVHLRTLLLCITVALLGIGVSLSTKAYPYAPLQFALLSVPMAAFALRRTVLRDVAAWDFFRSLSASLLAVAVTLTAYFTLWVFALPPPPSRVNSGWGIAEDGTKEHWTNMWGGRVKDYWRKRLRCDEDTDVEASVCYDAAFLWWFFPLIVALSLLMFAGLCRLLYGMLAPDRRKTSTIEAKMFLVITIIGFGGMYIGAEFAAAGMGLTDVVMMAMFVFLVAVVCVVGSTLGWDGLGRKAAALFRQKVSAAALDWIRALVLWIGVIPLLAWLGLSALNQCVRRQLPLSCTAAPRDGGHFTAAASRQIQLMRGWHWGSISSKIMIVGLVYLVMQVLVMKVTVIFLSWLNMALSGLALAAVIFIFIFVGICMFLIPVIPGIPVYICAGVLIPHQLMSEEEIASTDPQPPSSFWVGLLIASLLAIGLKFAAIAMQQELIGRMMGKHASIRAMCQINSTFMRAARFVLKQPGVTWGKAVILVGGPDWPTSVATGIMKLSCPQMLIGSIPVIFLVIPCTMTGAFQLMRNRPGWEVLAQLVTLISLGTQFGAMIGFAAVIEKASSKYADELAKMPYDEEVLLIDQQQAAYVKTWHHISDWHTPGYPLGWRVALVVGDVLVILACHMSFFLRCFEPCSVADQYDEPPINSNPFGIVTFPAGWAVITFFTLSTAIFFVHRHWLGRRVLAAVECGGSIKGEPGEMPGLPVLCESSVVSCESSVVSNADSEEGARAAGGGVPPPVVVASGEGSTLPPVVEREDSTGCKEPASPATMTPSANLRKASSKESKGPPSGRKGSSSDSITALSPASRRKGSGEGARLTAQRKGSAEGMGPAKTPKRGSCPSPCAGAGKETSPHPNAPVHFSHTV